MVQETTEADDEEQFVDCASHVNNNNSSHESTTLRRRVVAASQSQAVKFIIGMLAKVPRWAVVFLAWLVVRRVYNVVNWRRAGSGKLLAQ